MVGILWLEQKRIPAEEMAYEMNPFPVRPGYNSGEKLATGRMGHGSEIVTLTNQQGSFDVATYSWPVLSYHDRFFTRITCPVLFVCPSLYIVNQTAQESVFHDSALDH